MWNKTFLLNLLPVPGLNKQYTIMYSCVCVQTYVRQNLRQKIDMKSRTLHEIIHEKFIKIDIYGSNISI